MAVAADEDLRGTELYDQGREHGGGVAVPGQDLDRHARSPRLGGRRLEDGRGRLGELLVVPAMLVGNVLRRHDRVGRPVDDVDDDQAGAVAAGGVCGVEEGAMAAFAAVDADEIEIRHGFSLLMVDQRQ